jgi:hypothetical protein
MTFFEKIKDIDEHWKALFYSISLVTLTGIFPSVYFADWVWFSRCGSLLVVYGVYIVWLDYQGGIDDGLTKVTNAAKQKIGGKQSQDLLNTIESIRASNKKQYQTMEFLILGLGTLIWGYGDLIGKLYS